MRSSQWRVPVRPVVACSVAATCLALATPAVAQNEEALKAFFEGQHVVTRIDLPGTSDGVDVKVDRGHQIDYGEYGNRLKASGAALKAGDSATVTLVKVKKDLIEFQLSGGGYGTFGDDTSTSVYIASVEKSSREQELERLVKDEKDDRRKHQLQSELEDLRDRRERENRRIEGERVRASQIKSEQIAERRLRGGSRFNLRYADAVPRDIRPEGVMDALAEYVDFSSLGGPSISPAPPAVPSSPVPAPVSVASDASLRKGMSRAEAERLLGPARQSTDRREGDLAITALVFMHGDEQITAEFVDNVLVRYTISSK